MNGKNNKNIVDKFLDIYDEQNSNNVRYEKVYVRPSKLASFIGFVVSLFIFIIILSIFSFSFMYLLLFFLCLAVLIYYGINLFTKKGISLPRTIVVPGEQVDNESNNDDMRVQ